jgi:uncharacterized protein
MSSRAGALQDLDPGSKPSSTAVIDCDAHNHARLSDLLPYMPARWRDYLETVGLRTLTATVAPLRTMSSRSDAVPPSGIPGTDVDFFRRQLLDEWSLERAVLNPTTMWGAYVGSSQAEALNDALVCATNDWCAQQWLDADPRFVGALSALIESPGRAVSEIERWAGEPRFVQLLLPLRLRRPLGHPQYREVLRAAAARDLPVAMHPGPGENPGHPMTGTGWPSYYVEVMTNVPAGAVPHVLSLIFEGVFDDLPELKIVMTETGWSWLPALAARADRLYGLMPGEVPSLKRKPSEYIRDHFWFTSQPMEEPGQDRFFAELLEEAGIADHLLFATDYPHWDFDSPTAAVPATLPDVTRRNILADNARRLYGFEIIDSGDAPR